MIIDVSSMLDNLGGDLSLVPELVDIYRRDSEVTLATMRTAIARGQSEALSRAAHRVKGALSAFSAHAAVEAARQLEELARDGDLAGAEAAFLAFVDELERLGPRLDALVEDVG